MYPYGYAILQVLADDIGLSAERDEPEEIEVSDIKYETKAEFLQLCKEHRLNVVEFTRDELQYLHIALEQVEFASGSHHRTSHYDEDAGVYVTASDPVDIETRAINDTLMSILDPIREMLKTGILRSSPPSRLAKRIEAGDFTAGSVKIDGHTIFVSDRAYHALLGTLKIWGIVAHRDENVRRRILREQSIYADESRGSGIAPTAMSDEELDAAVIEEQARMRSVSKTIETKL